MRAIFRTQTEFARITLGDTLITPKLMPHRKLLGSYTHAIGCVRYCRELRNQYAHCHWMDDDDGGLFFTNTEGTARKAVGFDPVWLHVDVPLLTKQEDFFVHTMWCLWHIETNTFA